MSDGTRPGDGETPTAAFPPAPGGAQAAPPPPYAAPLPPRGPQLGVGYPDMPRQEYPGAPPTWGTAPGAPWQPSARPGGSPVLAILALCAAILAVLLAFLPFIGLIAWALIVTAVTLAIISLVRRQPGKGMSIAALIVAVFAAILSIVVAATMAIFGGLSALGPEFNDPEPAPLEDYSYPSLSAPELGPSDATFAEPLAVGTAVTLFDDNAGEEVWEITVAPFEDITASAASAQELPPVYGAFVAVPVAITNVSDDAIDLAEDYDYIPYSRFVTGDGGLAESAYLSYTSDLPSAAEVGTVEPGETVTYYEVFDVGPASVATGSYIVDLDSGQKVTWSSRTPVA